MFIEESVFDIAWKVFMSVILSDAFRLENP